MNKQDFINSPVQMRPAPGDTRAAMATRSERYGWIFVSLAAAALLVTVILLGIEVGNVVQIGTLLQLAAQCRVREDGLHCFTGNACNVSVLEKMCQDRNWPGDDDWALADQTCGGYACGFTALPDGSCCNARDFCYADDPTKTCLGGQCVSANYTLCRGWCAIDADCNGTYAVPVLPGIPSTVQCFNGACVTTAESESPFVSCEDLLNLTTLVQRHIAGCLQSYRFAYNSFDNFTYEERCVWKYRCSNGLQFGTQTLAPTPAPTRAPTPAPTAAPTTTPTPAPTGAPTVAPTVAPTRAPTVAPTVAPTTAPTAEPTTAPTAAPTV